MSVIRQRRASPVAITQALPSLLTVPSALNEMRLVSGPPDLLNRVISVMGDHHSVCRFCHRTNKSQATAADGAVSAIVANCCAK